MIPSKIRKEFQFLADPKKAKLLAGFFKTGKGEYAEGDRFRGVMVPQTRKIMRKYLPEATLADVKIILAEGWHEERLCALLMLVDKFEKGSEVERKKIFDFYLAHTKHINNWDLVDLSAPRIVGGFLEGKSKAVLDKLARSEDFWTRRIAILGTFLDIKNGDCKAAFRIAQKLLADQHDLIHKAVGWMLRECGKNCGEKKLEAFIVQNIRQMPRTTLRYAIERFPEKKRLKYLKM